MRPEMVLLILGMGAVTFLTRFAFLYLVGRVTLPPFVTRALPFVPIGILTAFVVPEMLFSGGRLYLSPGNEMLVGGFVAALIAARWRSVFGAMAGGMAVVIVMRHFLIAA